MTEKRGPRSAQPSEPTQTVKALRDLYDRHANIVYSLALRITKCPADAEDVTQEVFLQAWRQSARFDAERGSVEAWLLIMARTRSLDHLRREKRNPNNGLDPWCFDRFAHASPHLDVVAATAQQVERARGALARLPVEQREAMELVYFEGFTHNEIAVLTSEPLGTVKSRIRTALKQLRMEFEPAAKLAEIIASTR